MIDRLVSHSGSCLVLARPLDAACVLALHGDVQRAKAKYFIIIKIIKITTSKTHNLQLIIAMTVITRATGIGFSPILKYHEISNKYDRKRLNMA